MKKFLWLFVAIFSLSTFSREPSYAEHMNREGTCSGATTEGQKIDFNYYSNFKGCPKPSDATLVFSPTSSVSGLITGVRAVPQDVLDRYSFTEKVRGRTVVAYQLDVNQSDVQAMSHLTYFKTNEQGVRVPKTVEVKCHVQMYAYIPCGEMPQ